MMHTHIAPAFCVTLDRKPLADALAHFAKLIEARNTVPILGAVSLSVEDPGCVRVYGTDLDISLSIDLPADAPVRGRVLVDFKALKAALAKMKGGSVSLTDVGAHATALEDRSTGAKVRLMGLPRDCDDMPFTHADNLAHAFTLPAEQLRGDFERLRPCISTEETRYYLNGAYLHVTRAGEASPPELRLAATDGHRMVRIARAAPAALLSVLPDAAAEAEGEIPERHPLDAGAIIPTKAVRLLSRIIGTRGAGDVSLEFGRSKVRFRFGSVVLVSKLIDGTFPDYSRVIPSAVHATRTLTVNAETLADAVVSVTAHCTEKTRGVLLSMSPDWVTASATDASAGRAALEIGGAVAQCGDGDCFAIGFNAAYVAALAGMFGGEDVRLLMQDAPAPVLWLSDAAPEMLAVLMPMRLDGDICSPETIRRMNRGPADVFDEEAPRLAALEPHLAGEEFGRVMSEFIRYLLPSCEDRRHARLVARERLCILMGDTAGADRAAALRNALTGGDGSFLAMAERARALESGRAAAPEPVGCDIAPSPAETPGPDSPAPAALQPAERADVGELAELRALVEALTSRISVLESRAASPAPPAPANDDGAGKTSRERSPARLRMIRAYLRMRAQRDQARRQLHSTAERLAGADGRNARLARKAATERKLARTLADDLRGAQAETAAERRIAADLRRKLAERAPSVLPAPPHVGTMAVAFSNLRPASAAAAK